MVWNEFATGLPANTDRASLEAFVTMVVRMRAAQAAIEKDGMVVQDGRGHAVPHPAILIERQAVDQIRSWGDRFTAPTPARRRTGYMVKATTASIAAVPRLQLAQFSGPVAAVRTLAWLIDEAQHAGTETFLRLGRELVTAYIRTCTELQITPATLGVAVPAPPAEPTPGTEDGEAVEAPANIDDFRAAAAARLRSS